MSTPMSCARCDQAPAAALTLPPGGEGIPSDGMPAGVSPLVAADLQDHLLIASNDLERLQRLLSDAGDSLMTHFCGASAELRSLQAAAATLQPADAAVLAGALARALAHMAGAVTAMQFQDLSTQLIAHSTGRLRGCADRLACEVLGDDDDDGPAVVQEMPVRPNPVTQDEMDAGSIELF